MDVDFNRRVAAAVEDFPSDNIDNGGHGLVPFDWWRWPESFCAVLPHCAEKSIAAAVTAVKLESLVRRFNTGGGASRSAPAAANAASRPAQSPARALGAKVASAFGRGGGAATARREENWSEF